MKKYRKVIFCSLILIGLFGFNFVEAVGYNGPLVPCGTSKNPEDCTICHLWKLISNIINFISFNLAIPVAAFLFIVAGVIFLTSGGNQNRVGLARSILTNTIIGIAIIFVSWIFIDSLLKTVAKNEFVGAWNEFPTCSQ